ncbi:MAG: hypothetical protein HZY74_13300 [Brevundimonas sp.]|nr:MAG: hypothetical protein HZY74_13300 [Brevundimonas sp.]
MTTWTKGRGLLGPMKPLLGRWTAQTEAYGQPVTCQRVFEPFGKGWVRLDAAWNLPGQTYLETAFFGPVEDGRLGFFSFTNDGKRSTGQLADGTDVDPQAIAFEAQMPAGLARMIYWPWRTVAGFNFAVESRTKKGWNRFVIHSYRPES